MIRLLVVAEIRLYREGLARALDEDNRCHVIGTASSLDGAIELLSGTTSGPDIVLLDHAIPEGASAVQHLRRACPTVRVLALAVREVEADVISWAEAGAAGFVPRDATFDDLITAISAVAAGCGPCPPLVAALLLNRVATLAEERDSAPAGLTCRQQQVVLLIEEGFSNKEIALRLRIQVATVKNHVHSILEKLDVQRRGQAAAKLRARQTTSHGAQHGREHIVAGTS